jgi:hypothetical protein
LFCFRSSEPGRSAHLSPVFVFFFPSFFLYIIRKKEGKKKTKTGERCALLPGSELRKQNKKANIEALSFFFLLFFYILFTHLFLDSCAAEQALINGSHPGERCALLPGSELRKQNKKANIEVKT